MSKPYGRVPKEVRPYLPALADAIRSGRGRTSPYRVIAEAFGSSASRIQQIVLAERRKNGADLDAVPDADSEGRRYSRETTA